MNLSRNYWVHLSDAERYQEICDDPQKFRISGWLTRGIDRERMEKIKEGKEAYNKNEQAR